MVKIYVDFYFVGNLSLGRLIVVRNTGRRNGEVIPGRACTGRKRVSSESNGAEEISRAKDFNQKLPRVFGSNRTIGVSRGEACPLWEPSFDDFAVLNGGTRLSLAGNDEDLGQGDAEVGGQGIGEAEF